MEDCPGWYDRMCQGADKCGKFEDVRDVYTYLRSMRSLLEKSKSTWIDYDANAAIREKLEYVFSDEGFLSEVHIKIVVDLLDTKGLGPGVSYRQRLVELGLKTSGREEVEEVTIGKEYLKQGGRLARTRSWQWRVEAAVTASLKEGWYPLFGTYTVDPKRLPEGCLTRDELWTKTPSWDRFVKRFKTEVAEACGYGRKPAKWPKGSSFFQYFAVLEHGKSGKHPHVHVIFMCKEIPKSWKVDPNRNCATRMQVDMPAASSLWPHGVQRKTMALFIVGSWFTENWMLPNEQDGKPKEIGCPGAVAGYIGKYMTKGERLWNHRVKATKSLGLENLLKLLSKVKSDAMLRQMSLRPAEYKDSIAIQQATSCPLNLLREKSKKELMLRLHSTKTQQARESLRKEWTKKPLGFYTDFIASVKDGVRPWRMMREQRYSLYTLMLAEVRCTVHSKENRVALMNWLAQCLCGERASKPFTLLKVIE